MAFVKFSVLALAVAFAVLPVASSAQSRFEAAPTTPAPLPATNAQPSANVGAPAPSDAVGNRITVSVVDNCSTTVLGDDNCDYDNDDNRTFLADALSKSLTAKGFVVVAADQNPAQTLTVTVTGIGDNDPDATGIICGMICDEAADATASADYKVTDASGAPGRSGTLDTKADDTEPGLQLLADAIANAVTISAQAAPPTAPPPAASAPPGKNSAGMGLGSPATEK